MQVKVYKELSNFTPKVVGPFTLRQFGALLVCAPICLFTFTGLNSLVGTDIAGLVTVVPASLAFVFGWTKPYGMYVENFAVLYIKTRLIAPYKRKFVVKNTVVESVNDATAAWERENAPAPDTKKKRYNPMKKKQSLPDGAVL